MVNITLLGEQSVVDPVTERTLTLSARSVALLGLLISRTGSPQSRSAIAGAFWPDSSERQALTNLRRELHDLRQVIDDDSLEVTPTQLCWHDRGRHRVDLGIFLHEYAAAKAAGDDDGRDPARDGRPARSTAASCCPAWTATGSTTRAPGCVSPASSCATW